MFVVTAVTFEHYGQDGMVIKEESLKCLGL